MIEYGPLLTKEKIEENDKIEDIVNKDSKFETNLLVEKNLDDILEKESIQLERRGYFFIDKTASNDKNDKKVAVLHFIPDGKAKSMSIIATKVDPKATSGVKDDTKKSKKQEDREKKKEKEKDKEKPKKEVTEEDKKKAEEAIKKNTHLFFEDWLFMKFNEYSGQMASEFLSANGSNLTRNEVYEKITAHSLTIDVHIDFANNVR